VERKKKKEKELLSLSDAVGGEGKGGGEFLSGREKGTINQRTGLLTVVTEGGSP